MAAVAVVAAVVDVGEDAVATHGGGDASVVGEADNAAAADGEADAAMANWGGDMATASKGEEAMSGAEADAPNGGPDGPGHVRAGGLAREH